MSAKNTVIKKTKIVCTIGPASWSYETLQKLAQAGMDVVRLNFSHGTHESHGQVINHVRKISKELDKPLALLADLQGPKLRLGKIEGIQEIKKGETVYLSTHPEEGQLPMQFDLSPFVKKNQRIFLNDGLVELKVLDVHGRVIKTQSQNSGVVSSNKGVNVPDTRVRDGVFTDKDHDDAVFAISQNVDYIALSFVQTADDLKPLKSLLKKHNSTIKIIAKIEKKEALDNLEEILQAVDAIMIARGDLAIEIPFAEVPIYQQKMMKLARQYQKPVIVATQMLESMTENPRPTRAEASDVGNAVLDQADAVMLSAESASGKYPVETVQAMSEIIRSVEEHPDYSQYIKIDWQSISKENIPFSAVTSSAASLAYRINAKALIASTKSGRTAKLLASFRPSAPVIAITHDQPTSNHLALVWGIRSFIVDPTDDATSFLKQIAKEITSQGVVKKGDQVVVITGHEVGVSGSTDTIRVTTI